MILLKDILGEDLRGWAAKNYKSKGGGWKTCK